MKTTLRALILNENSQIVTGRFLAGKVKKNKFGFPGGGAEKGETMQQTIEREVFEETGLHIVPMSAKACVQVTERANVIHILAFALNPEKLADSDEMDCLAFRNLDTLQYFDHLETDAFALEFFQNKQQLPGQSLFMGWDNVAWSAVQFPQREVVAEPA